MSKKPTYTLGNDDPVLSGLPPLVRAQVVQTIMQQLLTECVDHVGGEIILPPGYRDRVGRHERTVGTRFLDDGSYRVWTIPMPEGIVFVGQGTRWERMEGPRRRDQEAVVYEVVEEDPTKEGLTGIKRVDGEGPILQVSTRTIRNGAGGWRAWRPPLELIEEAPETKL